MKLGAVPLDLLVHVYLPVWSGPVFAAVIVLPHIGLVLAFPYVSETLFTTTPFSVNSMTSTRIIINHLLLSSPSYKYSEV